jgi:heat shock protein HspQ
MNTIEFNTKHSVGDVVVFVVENLLVRGVVIAVMPCFDKSGKTFLDLNVETRFVAESTKYKLLVEDKFKDFFNNDKSKYVVTKYEEEVAENANELLEHFEKLIKH